MGELVFGDRQTVVFTGDSITDCGRRDHAAPLGAGYVRCAVDLITARYPERRLTFHNSGISGNCVDDLQGRWQTDVLDFKPDWVSILIGINDLHRTLNAVKELPPEAFEFRYRDILDRTVAAGARLVLIDPFYLSLDHGQPTHEGEVLRRLEGYLAVVEKLAGEYGALHCPMQRAWLQILPHHPAREWCPEPVHPNARGHLVMAEVLLRTLGW